MWGLKPSGSVQNMSLWLAFLKFMARAGAPELWPEQLKVMRNLIDAALSASYTSFKKEQVGAQAWWELFKDCHAEVLSMWGCCCLL